MPDCGKSCDNSKITFEWSPVSGFASLAEEGDLVVADIEETEFNTNSDHTGTKTLRSFKAATMVDITVSLFACQEWHKEAYELWKCNKGLCGDIVVNDPCCDVNIYERAVIKKMPVKTVGSSDAIEMIFSAYLPTCSNT